MPEIITWAAVWAFLKPFVKMAVMLLVGHLLIKYAMKVVSKAFGKSKLDPSLVKYCSKAATIALYIFLLLAALESIGVSTTSIVASMTAAVVAVGVALKDSLSNVAGGVWLLFSPRFATGDYIAASGNEGTVVAVELFHTTLQSPDGKTISIPNGVLINSHIVNYSHEQKRRVEILFPIPYEADVEVAKKLARDIIAKHPLVVTTPEDIFVRVRSYGDSAVNLMIRAWCKNEDYWNVYYDLIEQIRATFEANGISIPYNQLEVRLWDKEPVQKS